MTNQENKDPNVIRQWVSDVLEFSSQYNDTTWAARNIIGTPQVYPNYGDLQNSWGQSSFTNDQFIVLKFPEEVYVTEIHIYETYHSGAVMRIKLKDVSVDEWKTVWQSTEPLPLNIETSRIFSPKLDKTLFKTNKIRLELDCSIAQTYCEIDAVELVGKKFLINKVDCDKNLALNYKKLLESEEFSDVTFEIDGKLLKGHRNFFAARSNYFKSILCDNAKSDRLHRPIHLENITYEGFKSLMFYIYTDTIEENTNCETVCELIRVSDWYNLEKLENVSYEFIKSKLSLENICQIIVCAIKKEPQLPGIEKMCLKFIAKNFTLVLNRPEFKALDQNILVKITQFYAQFLNK